MVSSLTLTTMPSQLRSMFRSFVVLAIIVSACNAGQAQSPGDEIHLRAIVQDVVPLASFSGRIIHVDVDPRFALTVRIQSAVPAVAGFTEGSVVTLAIHSPVLLFAGKPTKGKTYDFSLRREVEHGKVSFLGIRLRKIGQPDQLLHRRPFRNGRQLA
jgi:hypothetical protein